MVNFQWARVKTERADLKPKQNTKPATKHKQPTFPYLEEINPLVWCESGLAAQVFNPSYWGSRDIGAKFKATLGTRPNLKMDEDALLSYGACLRGPRFEPH